MDKREDLFWLAHLDFTESKPLYKLSPHVLKPGSAGGGTEWAYHRSLHGSYFLRHSMFAM